MRLIAKIDSDHIKLIYIKDEVWKLRLFYINYSECDSNANSTEGRFIVCRHIKYVEVRKNWTVRGLKIMSDLRSQKRKQPTTYLPIANASTGETIGRVIDLTTEGIKLISDGPIDTGNNFELKMKLPRPILGNGEVSFEAGSLWTKRDVNPFYNVTGFRISNLSPNDQKRIKFVMRHCSFDN